MPATKVLTADGWVYVSQGPRGPQGPQGPTGAGVVFLQPYEEPDETTPTPSLIVQPITT